MKQFLFIAHTIFIFFGCTSPSEKKASHSGKLNFEPVTIQSKILSGKAQLEANPEQQKLLLNIKLTNNTDEAVPVESINIETAEGYQAKLISPELKSFTLSAGTDTMITLQFKPVNNFELYMLTGESGKFKPLYNFSVVYKDDKNENLIKAQFNVLNEDFAEYEKNYRQTVVAYKFNCENSFAEKQKKYLQSLAGN